MNFCTISNWYGRFGNNVQQISNGIFYAKENGIGFYSPEHQIFNSFFSEKTEKQNCIFKSVFYDFIRHENNNFNLDFSCNVEKLNKERHSIVANLLLPHLKITPKKTLDKDTVVIHIRTGDIFTNNPHKLYVQNPLSFFKKIIKKYNTAIIVCENKNYIVDNLLEEENVFLHSKSLEEDLSLILAARNLVSSGVGTFSIAAAMLSKNIENFYYTNIFLEDHLNPTMLSENINKICYNINLENYIKIGEWKNSENQRKLMLNYDLEKGC